MKVGFYAYYEHDPERQIYIDILEYNGIKVDKTSINDPVFWDKVDQSDAFMFKWGNSHNVRQIALTILPIIEKILPGHVFPNQESCWHYDDKIKQDYLLKSFGFPFVKSWIFFDKQKAIDWAQGADYPVVFKLRQGSGSWNVFLIHNKRRALQLIHQMFGPGRWIESTGLREKYTLYNKSMSKVSRYYLSMIKRKVYGEDVTKYWLKQKNYIYLQKFCAGNTHDTRVTTAGNRAHAFRRFVRDNDFRASGSDNWSIDPDSIDMRMVKIALEISKKFGFQSMAYDFVYDENQNPQIVEISYAYGRAGYPDFMNGYWDDKLNWHPGRFWPQQFELADLLGIDDLKVPTIDIMSHIHSSKMN